MVPKSLLPAFATEREFQMLLLNPVIKLTWHKGDPDILEAGMSTLVFQGANDNSASQPARFVSAHTCHPPEGV